MCDLQLSTIQLFGHLSQYVTLVQSNRFNNVHKITPLVLACPQIMLTTRINGKGKSKSYYANLSSHGNSHSDCGRQKSELVFW